MKNSPGFFSKSDRLPFFDDAEEDGGVADDEDEDEDGALLLPDPE
jgi:hypothetical protein